MRGFINPMLTLQGRVRQKQYTMRCGSDAWFNLVLGLVKSTLDLQGPVFRVFPPTMGPPGLSPSKRCGCAFCTRAQRFSSRQGARLAAEAEAHEKNREKHDMDT